jgi:hypothetical protein
VGTRENSCSGKISDEMKWGYKLESDKTEEEYEYLLNIGYISLNCFLKI